MDKEEILKLWEDRKISAIKEGNHLHRSIELF